MLCFNLTFSPTVYSIRNTNIYFPVFTFMYMYIYMYVTVIPSWEGITTYFNCISNLEKQWYERVKCGLLIRIKYIWISIITLLAKQNDSQRFGCNDCPIYDRNTKNGELIDFYLHNSFKQYFCNVLIWSTWRNPCNFYFILYFCHWYMNI